ncbi:fungal-specific transcription factor domain-containing protein [Stachybotrys elegans]|uniref:Fungal-specific transcription factor domain-containing protein n=1 Tax=Stachybotrys elegans TaxID=80388 RepID=A0A8K0SG57_9HYPO|nr:fungal-specific transcription factor domain-containing protein [Stachybotrys elegans]
MAELSEQNSCSSLFDASGDLTLTSCRSQAELSIESVEDAGLLAHYVGKTFQWQFRFITPGDNVLNQGYFLWLMSKYRPLYMASLALSNSHRSLCRAADPPQPEIAYDNHAGRYNRAAEEFRHSRDAEDSVGSIGMLACTVSFISSSLLHPDNVEWNTHLQMGVALITPWIVQQPAGVGPEAQGSIEDTTRSFFISSIMRFHILSAITQEATPSMAETYQRVLCSESPQMPMDRVSGCENWVFSLLLDVYLLRDWRRRCRAAGMLSLWELTSKANTIKHELESRIERGIKELDARKTNERQGQATQPTRYDICVTTHVFACAVSVLLEVVVSGWYPHLPEIREKVERTVEAFAYIEDSDLVGALGWPLFVVGCVVAEEQYELIRQMLWSSPVVRYSGVGGMLENCWKMRENGQVKSDSFDFSLFRTCGAHQVLVA